MHSVCGCSLSVWRSFLKKSTPVTYFGPALGRICPKNNNTCNALWVLHPYQVSSKSIKWFWKRSLRAHDGRCSMTIAHLSIWLRWAKNDGQKDEQRTTPDHKSALEPSVWDKDFIFRLFLSCLNLQGPALTLVNTNLHKCTWNNRYG